MSVKWTREQLDAIETHKKDILVSAAAGSGKTAVLVERILQLVCDPEHPVDIDHLLVVTFTRAAAGEMKERILRALEEKLQEDPENEHLQHQIYYIHNAQISTIDGFCAKVIRDYYYLIDLDPGYRTADEGELKLLKGEVISEVLENAYEEGGDAFEKFVKSYSPGKTDSALEERILELYELSQSHPWPDEWLRSCLEIYGEGNLDNLDKTGWFRDMIETIEAKLRTCLQILESGLEITRLPEGPHAYQDTLQTDMDMIKDVLENTSDYDSLFCSLRELKLVRLSGKKDPQVSEELKTRVKTMRDQVKDIIKELQTSWVEISPGKIRESMEKCRSNVEILIRLARSFSSAFAERKRKKNILDFSDMEHLALRILIQHTEEGDRRSIAARELSRRFEEILIDEYQDSNYVQEKLLISISRHEDGENNIFMVGDVKQSIYRFRLADPELFMEKYHTYPREKDQDRMRIDLHQNFRSRREVLSFTNYIFEKTMRRSFGGVAYDERAALHPGAEFPENQNGETEILLIDKDNKSLKELELKGEEKELEARMIGKRIRELVREFQVYDTKFGGYRPFRYSDCVILLRSVSGYGEIFGKVLQSMGIPAYVTTRTGYFTAVEVVTLLNFLHICDNPRQDIPFTAILHSPIVGLTAKELTRIRIQYPEGEIYDCCIRYSEMGQDMDIRASLKEFFLLINEIRDLAVYTPIHELIYHILERTGYGSYVRSMQNGEQRYGNLLMLIEKAKDYEKTSYRGLFNFIRYIEQLQKYEVDFGEVNVSGESENLVRIMTIHKSKGLEFPVVFLAGLGKKFNLRDLNTQVIIHSKLGIATDYIDPERRIKNVTAFKKVVRRKMLLETLSEELRVLYVALTRAKEKLILTGTVDHVESRRKKYEIARGQKMKGLPEYLLESARDYLGWILPALDEGAPCHMHWTDPRELVIEESQRLLDKEVQKNRLINLSNSGERSKFYLQLEERFNFSYPFEEQKSIPAKVTVSDLKGRVFEEEPRYDLLEPEPQEILPAFLDSEERRLAGAERGTAYHRIFQLLDYERLETEEEIRDQIENMVRENKLTEEMLKSISIPDFFHFGESSLGRRMKQASLRGELFREQPFTMGIPASDLDKGYSDQDQILVQGIIDAYFIEDGELVLVDYKTDKTRSPNVLVRRYAKQLEYYARALEDAGEKNVKERVIYSVTMRKGIECK